MTRLSHGVRAAEDPGLVVAELADRGTVLEVCPTSNVALGVYPGYAEHPFTTLRDAGVALTLASDDPPCFAASIGSEYAVAAQHFGLDDAELTAVTATALRASFATAADRAALLERLHANPPAREGS